MYHCSCCKCIKGISFCGKVLELQEHVSRLQTLNNDLQSQLSPKRHSERDAEDKEDKDHKKQLQRDEVVHKVVFFSKSFKRRYFLSFISNISSRECPRLENT